jgi:hypothetical protein
MPLLETNQKENHRDLHVEYQESQTAVAIMVINLQNAPAA